MNYTYREQVEQAKRNIARAHESIIKTGTGLMGILIPTVCGHEPSVEACRALLREIPPQQAEWVIFVCIECERRVYPDERTFK